MWKINLQIFLQHIQNSFRKYSFYFYLSKSLILYNNSCNDLSISTSTALMTPVIDPTAIFMYIYIISLAMSIFCTYIILKLYYIFVLQIICHFVLIIFTLIKIKGRICNLHFFIKFQSVYYSTLIINLIMSFSV